jgi:hypothetical protein
MTTSLLQDSKSITNASVTATPLESQARSILASSVLAIGTTSSSIYYYPRAYNSSEVDGVVDSTTVLLAARTLSKLGRSDLSWEFLRTLFSAQSSNGFLPKIVYLNHTTNNNNKHEFEGAAWSNFLGPYPGPKLFANKAAATTASSEEEDLIYNPLFDTAAAATTKLWSSNTIMATPHHATSILDIFYLSNQTSEDVNNLSIFYTKLQKWHDYLHQQIISNCISGDDYAKDAAKNNDTSSFPCLLLRHPMETEIDLKSPIWESALMNVTKIVKEKKFHNSSISIPKAVKDSFDYPGDDMYNSYLYLLQCLNNEGKNTTTTSHNNSGNNGTNYTNHHDNIFYSRCPFGMLDVGFSAALSLSDKSLEKIIQILVDKNQMTRHDDKMTIAKARTNRSMDMLNALWDEERGSFFNRLVMLTENDHGWYSSSNNRALPLEASIAYNFFSLADPMLSSSLVAKMTTQLLQRSGKFSFNCGDYPVWSVGGCKDSPPIIPLVNLRVSTGLVGNGEVGLGDYISNGLLDLICGLPNSGESNLKNCSNNFHFASAFNATNRLPLGNNIMESTLTAAIVLDILIPDTEFAYESEPPISSSSVIFLIAAELVVAFAVGVVCLVLSMNLMHRVNADEEGDEFVQLVNEQQHLYEETEDVEDAAHASGIGAWSLELISSLSPMKWWERRHAE